ncbi:MAG TPA: cytochrome c biogenesis protein [Blastocatellia bacterium]|nr:cytochrome c biogenesis protein [Blastocatellia bacterium]
MQLLWIIIIAGYALCTAHAIYTLTTKRQGLNRAENLTLAVALVAHTVWLLERGIRTGRCPMVGTQESSAFLSWSLVVLYLLAQRWYQTGALKAFILPIALALAGVAAFTSGTLERPDGINEPLQRILFPVHAGLILLAFAAFFISFGAGLMYIIQERELKHKRLGAIFYKLPSLEKCDAISFKSMTAGLILLTVGILAGIAWSKAKYAVYWHNDPEEVIALVIWLIYLLIIQSRLSAGWGGRRAAVASIIGFVLVVCSLAGLRYLGTLHVF